MKLILGKSFASACQIIPYFHIVFAVDWFLYAIITVMQAPKNNLDDVLRRKASNPVVPNPKPLLPVLKVTFFVPHYLFTSDISYADCEIQARTINKPRVFVRFISLDTLVGVTADVFPKCTRPHPPSCHLFPLLALGRLAQVFFRLMQLLGD
jgi:hypothetical protein